MGEPFLLVGDVRGDAAGEVEMGASTLASGLRVLVKRDPGVLASAGLVDLEFDFPVDVGEPSLLFGLAVRGRRT